MENEKRQRLGIVGVTSKQAGTAVGTAAAVGKKIVGAGVGGVTAVGRALRKSVGLLRFRSARERIRSVVVEELSRLVGKEMELTGVRLEERLRVMAQTLAALQERINKLSAHGPISSADIWKEIGALEAAAPLTNDERAVLVSIFRQNIALQKVGPADAAVEDNEAE